ncbi:glycosyltransferase family 4 protein [Niabella ginsengisoli]|uniref:Glycosyltransferase family 4 protein n=1 Tax=Niabella ginsengisoli TaxID=522298 RepID=A0ABS9SMT3_9BACT|nr:glycosyltransferase family 4 protein [Niabella ginsengisoli]MCH5599701.1 glycosyltransferase family 4 protein [Niabella ginsengisoli]
MNDDNGLYASYVVNTARFTEISLMNQYDRILILNRNDQARLSEYIPIKKLQVMPTSVPESLIPNCKPTASAEKLVFMGSQEHHPNMDGVQWFSEEMLDQAVRQSGLELYVTGKWKDIFRHQHPRINFTGFVDNIGDVLQGGILIAPIRLGGGGIRIKILQAMACGVPVIATSLITNGMEGIVHGENIFIADTVEEFIAAITTLATNNNIYTTVSKNGMVLIEKYYGDKAAIKIKEKIFEELLSE